MKRDKVNQVRVIVGEVVLVIQRGDDLIYRVDKPHATEHRRPTGKPRSRGIFWALLNLNCESILSR
jgi:hypothetical protein